MNQRSLLELSAVAPQLSKIMIDAARALSLQGMEIVVVSGLRTAAQQTALYNQGRFTPGHVVTEAKAGQSMHNYGLAVDVVPYIQPSGPVLNWKPQTPQFQRMVATLKDHGLEWGGDWKGDLGDFDHFQLSGLPSSPSAAMLADYVKHIAQLKPPTPLQAFEPIWANAASGAYRPAEA